MAIEALWAKEVYDQMTGNTALMAKVTGVYDVKPQDTDSGDTAVFPYVTMGIADLGDHTTATESGFHILQRIHSWSREDGQKEVLEVQALIYGALHRKHAAMSISGYTIQFLDRTGSFVAEKDPGGAFHGVCEYEAIVTADAAD